MEAILLSLILIMVKNASESQRAEVALDSSHPPVNVAKSALAHTERIARGVSMYGTRTWDLTPVMVLRGVENSAPALFHHHHDSPLPDLRRLLRIVPCGFFRT
nr:hypothetical protein [Comamonas testosteroni]